jgi:hypothetical protein
MYFTSPFSIARFIIEASKDLSSSGKTVTISMRIILCLNFKVAKVQVFSMNLYVNYAQLGLIMSYPSKVSALEDNHVVLGDKYNLNLLH